MCKQLELVLDSDDESVLVDCSHCVGYMFKI